MTKSYVVSGQGARYPDERFRVPPHVEIHFYMSRLKAPSIYKPRTILDKLMVELSLFRDRVTMPGEVIPAYYCWAYPGEAPASGVFRRSTGELSIDLADASSERPVSLRHIVAEVARAREQKATVVHWLVRTEDVAGSAAAVQEFTPPRLRGASAARDAEESAHVALASMLPQPWQG
ncbi:MAG TPA: hypothetical protein VF457_07980, partial [Burkholderiaceae bacterium]